jgi:uncharacterized protein (DUF885 family)
MSFAAKLSILLVSFTAALWCQPSMSTQPKDNGTSSLEARRMKLKNLVAEEWEYELKESPESATIYGDYRYNDRWSDYSLAHVAERKECYERFLARFEAIDVTGFPEQEQLDRALMVHNLKRDLESIALRNDEMPLDQFRGVHLWLAQFAALVPLDNTKHYEDYLSRLHRVPRVFDQVITLLEQGEKDGLMPPNFLLQKVVTQCESIAAPTGEDNVFGGVVKRFPASMPLADQKRLHDQILNAVDTEVRPSYAKLATFVKQEYAPKGRVQPGLWALPDGDARYRFAVRNMTTTEMTPEAIHELGLAQVKEIEEQMTALAKRLGFADLKSFRASLQNNPKLTPESGEQILDSYRKYIGQMQLRLPQLFGLLPKAPVEVVAVEPFREKESAAAQYVPATPDGSRPGKVYVNTGDFKHRTMLNVEATAYHEGVPGHHLQTSIAQELPSLAAFRQHGWYTAYGEGWALYAERLGKDLGFYQDPYSDYGRLTSELLRATRLVLDTGVHYKHWTREQMVDFFRQHSDEDEPDIQAETDRYIAMPAQALAYKIGQLKFLELRERAKKELGNQFDIRAFHDEMLSGGALPLDILDSRTSAWIGAQKKFRPESVAR